MTRTAEKITALVREDAEMVDALETVRDQADANGGELEWGMVSDELTSGQWGRLIEKGILVDGDDGFRIADRAAYDRALDEDADEAAADVDIDPEQTKWTKWDKLAGAVSILFMIGYWMEDVRDTVGGTIDLAMAPLDAALPFYAVILAVALLTGLYSTLLQANLMNPEVIGQYQQRMKAMQEKQKDVAKRKKEAEERDASEAELERLENEMEAVKKEQMEAMGENIGMFKEQFRPMVWIMLFTIPLFLWMYWKILDGHVPDTELEMVMPIAGEVDLDQGIIGPMWAWIVWYFLCSMGFTQLLRKALNIDMTPAGT